MHRRVKMPKDKGGRNIKKPKKVKPKTAPNAEKQKDYPGKAGKK
jgi:hypothetical protein